VTLPETNSVRPVVLRNGVDIEDPLRVVLGFVEAGWAFGVSDPLGPASFRESDLRLANRGGARISAAEIAAILERRGGSSEPYGRSLPMRLWQERPTRCRGYR